ncbi:MATE family efflux transporter [Halegenticoccus tardaugens]|uniref:MATE family efflux transporter n=1 Tax=Halegenticoccus tardaugens TaxID=2071624 RepID=UPI00100B553D
MIRLAWPMVVIQLLQVAYNVADTFWLGRLSADAVGALSLAFPLIFFFISVGGGFTAAGSILVAQYRGADSDRSAGLIAGQTLSFVTLIAVAIAVAGFLLTGPLLALLPTDPETGRHIVPLAADYMRIFFLGMPFLFGFFVFISLMRGYGDTRTPMRVMVVSVAVNVVLDPLFIFGAGPIPAMGIEGAAVATVGSRMIATALGLYVLFGTSAGPSIHRGDLSLVPSHVRDIVSLGVPTALEQSSSAMAMILMTGMVATFPPAVVAAYGLGNRLISLVFLPAMGLAQAVDTVVGQNLGADEPERAERASRLAMTLVTVVLLVPVAVALLFPDPIVGVFLPPGTERAAETVGFASEYLRIAASMFVFMGVLQIALGTFRGAGNTKTALAFSMVTLWVVRLPATYYLVFVAGWGPTGIWTAVALGDVVGAVAAVAWLLRGTWKERIVDGTADGISPTGDEPGGGPARSAERVDD